MRNGYWLLERMVLGAAVALTAAAVGYPHKLRMVPRGVPLRMRLWAGGVSAVSHHGSLEERTQSIDIAGA
jgi:hypothetical protein